MRASASAFLAALSLSLGGCNHLLGEKPPLAVTIPRDCEHLAHPVAHTPVVRGVTDAVDAYEAEKARLKAANDRLDATRRCQARQREKFATAKAR